MEFRIAADEPCPTCGRVGSPKVTDKDGTQWWKCTNTSCTTAYYEPITGRTEARLSLEEERALNARIDADVERFMAGKANLWRTTAWGFECKVTPPDAVADLVKAGWREGFPPL